MHLMKLTMMFALTPALVSANEFRLCPSDVESFVMLEDGAARGLDVVLIEEAADRLYDLTTLNIGEKLVVVDIGGKPLTKSNPTIRSPIRKRIRFSLDSQVALRLQEYLESGSCERL